jgi:hypothetical protein
MSERTQWTAPGADAQSAAEVANEASVWLVGGGIVTTALFPLALPGIVLAALIAVPLIPIALVGGLVAAPVMLARRLRRGSPRSPATGTAEPLRRSAPDPHSA